MHGRNDRTAPVAFADQMRAHIPDSRLIFVNGGHLFPLTHPRLLADEVDTFLTPGH